MGLFLAESSRVLQDNKPCGTKPAVIIKRSGGVMPAHAGTECSGSTPFPPLKSLIRKLGSSQSLATSFQHVSSGPGDHGKKHLTAFGLKEILEGPSCQPRPLPTPSIYPIPTLAALIRTTLSILGLLARERERIPLGVQSARRSVRSHGQRTMWKNVL